MAGVYLSEWEALVSSLDSAVHSSERIWRNPKTGEVAPDPYTQLPPRLGFLGLSGRRMPLQDWAPKEEARLKALGYRIEAVNGSSRARSAKERAEIIWNTADSLVRRATGLPAGQNFPPNSNFAAVRKQIASREMLRPILEGRFALVAHNITNDYGQQVISLFFKPAASTEYPYGFVFDPSEPGYVPRQRDPWESPVSNVPALPATDPVYGDNRPLTEDDRRSMGPSYPIPDLS